MPHNERHRGLRHDLCALLEQNIESREQLSVLLFLHARRPEWHRIDALSNRLGCSSEAAEKALAKLSARGLLRRRRVTSALAYCYGPVSPALARAVDALASVHADEPLEASKLLRANPSEGMRQRSVRAFRAASRQRDGARWAQGPTKN